MSLAIREIAHYLPEATLTNAALTASFSGLVRTNSIERLGISQRHIAGSNESAADLAVIAGQRILMQYPPSAIDYLILCSQSTVWKIPNTSGSVQEKLGLSRDIGAVDVGLGCSGFVYCLGLAYGLLQSRQATSVLLLTADTYSKYIGLDDLSCLALFGDASAACVVEGASGIGDADVPFLYGSDGRGAQQFRIEERVRNTCSNFEQMDRPEELQPVLQMNGAGMVQFVMNQVPMLVRNLLTRARKQLREIDIFVFHQANAVILEELRKELGIPREKMVIRMENCGNTTSSSIPIALDLAFKSGQLRRGDLVMLIGFGSGFSWAGTIIRW